MLEMLETFDMTIVFKAIWTILVAVIVGLAKPRIDKWLAERMDEAQIKKAKDIAAQVVKAAWELDITGELVALGVTKVEYAWQEAKKLLAAKKITVNDDELFTYIKSSVAALRIERGDIIEEPEEQADTEVNGFAGYDNEPGEAE